MRRHPYPAFGLSLVVNHACNLRCTYCYTGSKFSSPMPRPVGDRAIRRAFASVADGGHLAISFFGGEPLLEAESILHWMETARRAAQTSGKSVRFNLTTNGTVATPAARQVMRAPDLELAVSSDGTREVHDLHRRNRYGARTAALVEGLLAELVRDARPFTVVTVVRPDTLDQLPAGLAHLRSLGASRFTLSLDLWTHWSADDLVRLERVVDTLADLWRSWLPHAGIDWFDTRVATLARLVSSSPSTRCGFGEGELAVAPSGRLYPCERLVGEDQPSNPLRLPGVLDDYLDFLDLRSPCAAGDDPAAAPEGGCPCSNYVRTGSTVATDILLRSLDQAANRAVERIIKTTGRFVVPVKTHACLA